MWRLNMPENKAQKIADRAEVIVDGYAILRKRDGYQIVNLHSGNVTMVSNTLKVLSTSMHDIELVIAIDKLRNNLEFMAA